MKSFVLSLAFILRFTATRKWPNHFQVLSFDAKQNLLQLWLKSMVFNLVVKPNQRFTKKQQTNQNSRCSIKLRGPGNSCGLVSFLIGGETDATLY